MTFFDELDQRVHDEHAIMRESMLREVDKLRNKAASHGEYVQAYRHSNSGAARDMANSASRSEREANALIKETNHTIHERVLAMVGDLPSEPDYSRDSADLIAHGLVFWARANYLHGEDGVVGFLAGRKWSEPTNRVTLTQALIDAAGPHARVAVDDAPNFRVTITPNT